MAGLRGCRADVVRQGREGGTGGEGKDRDASTGIGQGGGAADAFGCAGYEDVPVSEGELCGGDEGVRVVVDGPGEVFASIVRGCGGHVWQ